MPDYRHLSGGEDMTGDKDRLAEERQVLAQEIERLRQVLHRVAGEEGLMQRDEIQDISAELDRLIVAFMRKSRGL